MLILDHALMWLLIDVGSYHTLVNFFVLKLPKNLVTYSKEHLNERTHGDLVIGSVLRSQVSCVSWCSSDIQIMDL